LNIKFRANQLKNEGGFRDYKSYLFVGTKGQGKSTLMRDLMDVYMVKFSKVYQKSNVKPRVFVHDYSESRAFSDIMTVEEAARRMRVDLEHPMDLLGLKDRKGNYVWKSGMLRYTGRDLDDIEKMYRTLMDHFRNGFLLLDELTSYVSARPPRWLTGVLVWHRNAGVELAFAIHHLLDVPNTFSRGIMLSKLILMNSGEKNITLRQLKSKYSFADELFRAYQRVLRAKPKKTRVQYYEIINIDE
jgi:hypothetical protein